MGMLANRRHTHQLPLGRKTSDALDNAAYGLFLAAGLLMPLLQAGKKGRVQELRSLEALLLSVLSVHGLKAVVPSQRPDSLQENSFPSSHTMNTVVIATVASAFHKKQAPLWYGGAALIGVSRLLLRRHRGRDVLAGSLLGYGLARWELSRRRGVFLPPLATWVAKRIKERTPQGHSSGRK